MEKVADESGDNEHKGEGGRWRNSRYKNGENKNRNNEIINEKGVRKGEEKLQEI